MSRNQLEGYCFLALAMITVGSTVIASKIAGAGLSPFTATALRFAVAFPVFLLLMRLTRTAWPRPDRHDAVILVIQAVAGSVGYTTLLISGLRLTSASDAGVMIGTLPVVSAAIAITLLRERPHRALLLAIALATGGVSVLVFQPHGAPSSLLGNALIFGAIACEGLFILLNKRLRTAIAPLALSTLMTGIGLAAASLAAIAEAPWNTPATSAALWAAVYYALVPTVAGFLLWYAGAERVSGAEAALFTALAPVSALVLAWLVLDERIGMHQLLGVGCVLAAVASLVWPRTAIRK